MNCNGTNKKQFMGQYIHCHYKYFEFVYHVSIACFNIYIVVSTFIEGIWVLGATQVHDQKTNQWIVGSIMHATRLILLYNYQHISFKFSFNSLFEAV